MTTKNENEKSWDERVDLELKENLANLYHFKGGEDEAFPATYTNKLAYSSGFRDCQIFYDYNLNHIPKEKLLEIDAVRELVEALKYYADQKNWGLHGYDEQPGLINGDDLEMAKVTYPDRPTCVYDEEIGGKRAREALKHFELEQRPVK